jgi:adenylylsulfate kinase
MCPAPAIWITGPPAAGKSTLAAAIAGELSRRGVKAAVLESDAARRIITPDPAYDQRERDLFYAALAYTAMMLTRHGVTTIIDATANRRSYRRRARDLIPRFIEVLVHCPAEVRARRDPKGILKAAAGRAGNTVPGLGVPYEPPLHADYVVNGECDSPAAAAERIVAGILAARRRRFARGFNRLLKGRKGRM